MNIIDIAIYSSLAAAAIFAVFYGLPYVLIALVALGAIHSYPQFKQWFCRPDSANPVPPTA